MKNTITRFISAVATVAVLATGAQASAAASSLSINPASGSYAKGSTFSVSIVETGDNVQAVTVNLSYNAAQLTCNGVGGGAFASQISATCGGGQVTISRYVTPGQAGLNGAQVVGTLNFTAIAGTGTTSLVFGASQIASNGVNTLGSSAGAAYTLTTPATSTPSNPSTGNTNGTTTTRLNPATATSSSSTTTSNVNASTNTANTANEPAVLSETQKNKEDNMPATSTNAASTVADNKQSNVGANIAKLLVLVAVAAGIVAAQRYRANQLATANAAAVAASAKKAKSAKKAVAKKTPSKTTKKTTRKK